MHNPVILRRELGSPFNARWDWRELQIDDGHPVPGKVMPKEALIIKQHFGRRLELARFYQYPTSSAVVIRFQEHFGLPADQHVVMQIVDLDWPAHARDWER